MFDTKSKQKLGNDGFIWFYGVVEDNDDPLQLGRLRVRVLGDHTQSKNLIPTEELPWAYVINNIQSSSMQGIGDSPTGLTVLGSWVFGFYCDGIDKQQPTIVGSFGGIPESIPWRAKLTGDNNYSVGFQDPKEVFPMGHHIFEQDTNRLARNTSADHAIEIPESLVPPQEKMIEGGSCPKKPVFSKGYYDEFGEPYVRKFAHNEEQELTVQDKDDDTCQYFIIGNNHPFTVYKFINRERFIPKAKVFADPIHREYWHEPDNPWNAQYPYNKVWEGYHETGSTLINNPKNGFVSESYGYDQTINNYDGSDKEGIHRKQLCGVGSWGLGEEWDSTEGAQRYHRFHPSGNYFEIDNSGNEVRKIYGDSFEIDIKDKTLLIKGDWNVTVEGSKNELIEKDYNLQVMGDLNTDVRGDIKTHTDGKAEYHHRGNRRLVIDSDDHIRIGGSRNTSVLVDDYIESQSAERRADKISRKGGISMIDEAFVSYELKAHEMNMNVCMLENQIENVTNTNTTVTNDITSLTEKISSHTKDVSILTEVIEEHEETTGTHTEIKGVYFEEVDAYSGCIRSFELNTEEYLIFFKDILEVTQVPIFDCPTTSDQPVISSIPSIVDTGTASYPETDGISQCLKSYHECIEAAKISCMTTLKDPRTLEDYTRFDWEKYHASIDSCRRSYEACVEANKGAECGICDPTTGTLNWECMPCHDPNCPSTDKVYEFYECPCECHEPAEEVIIDPWKDCENETP